MIYGTAYFPTRQDALKYFKVLDMDSNDVNVMIKLGKIHIGKPPGLDSLRRAVLHKDQGGSQRYFIHEDVKLG